MAQSRRHLELVLFDQLYQASARGEGAVLLVSGPVGTGKTALLQEMAARAGRRGGWSSVVTGSARERGHPFGVLERLIRSMCVAGMAEPFPGGVDGGEDFFVMMDRVGAAVREFAGDRPVLVGLDDVHFADEQSLRALSYLVGRIESSGVVVVLNESTSYERDLADLWAEMLHLPYCHRVRLTPLSSADVAEQLRARFGGVPDQAAVPFCTQVSGGIPLLLQALIDDLAAGSCAGAGEPGANFRQAVLRSLHRCAPSTAAVARAVAVLGEQAASKLVAELGGVDVALVDESIRDLQEMGLVERNRFRHPHTRDAVLAGIPLPDLPEMHRRAAELLHRSGAPASAVAEQLIAAQDGGKASWRVVIFCEAAREAMAVGDVDGAVLSLRHAVGASADETQRARAGVLLAEALWHTNPSRAARHLGELGQDARAGLFTGPDTMIAVNQLLWWGEFAEADELLRLADEEECDESSLAHLWAIVGGAGGGAEPADSPLAQSGPIAVATYLSSACLTFDDVKTDRTDQMVPGIRAGAPLTPAVYALAVLVQTGRLEEAITWCDRLLTEEWIDRTPMRRVMIQTVEAVAMLRAGNSACALRVIREVLDAVPPPAWGVVAGLPLSIAVRASTDLGDTDAARSYSAVAVPRAMFDTPFALPYLLALGRYHLAMGHPESALTHTRSSLELITRWGVDVGEIAAGPAGLDVSWSPSSARDRAGVGKRCLFGVDEPAPGGTAATAASPDAGADGRHGEMSGDGKQLAAAQRGADDGAGLTGAEQRVAALAAAGNTNRQIAENLFITVSTVEQHLTKVYRKLNLHSRSGLRRYCA